MLIQVKYFGLLSNKMMKKEEEIELHEGAKISHLLEKLSEKYSESIKILFYTKKEKYILQPAFRIKHNGKLMIQPHWMNTKLSDKDVVALIMTIGGG